jgi:integrase
MTVSEIARQGKVRGFMGVKVRERDGAWWIFVNHKGRRKAKRVGTEKAAREAAKKIEARLTLGQFNLEQERRFPTFREYAEKWLALPHDWKEATREEYRSRLKLYVYPSLGSQRLNAITRKDLRALFDKLVTKELSPRTLDGVKILVSFVLAGAVDDEIIPTNPGRDLRVMKGVSRKEDEINPLTEEEAAKLLVEFQTFLGGKYYAAAYCLLATGLRIGELEALQWGDVDFNGNFLLVSRSHRKGRITATKTGKRKRVDLSPRLAEMLRDMKAARKVVPLGEDVDFVFGNGDMFSRDTFQHALCRCLDKAGLRHIRVHDLRHTYATIRLLKGDNVIDVSRQLGHANPTITLKVYAGWVPGKFKSQVAELDAALTQPDATQAQPGLEDSKKLQQVK